MLFICSTQVLIRHLWELKTIVFLYWCLICAVVIDLKRITRCKLALIFTSADHRKFLGLFGSSNEATLEGYVIKMFLFCFYNLWLGCLRTITFPKLACPDNPEVASSYSFQIYGCCIENVLPGKKEFRWQLIKWSWRRCLQTSWQTSGQCYKTCFFFTAVVTK
jgi:hypothetical protein